MTLTTPIFSQSLVDQAFDKLAAAIMRGELAPGGRISEVQVARQLGISRGPLREALSRLEARALVERRPNLGAYVSRLSRQDLEELFTLREALEGMACRLAALNMSDRELDELTALLDHHAGSEGLRAGTDYYQDPVDEDFHFRIVRGSGNRRLMKALCDDLYFQLRIYRYRSSTADGRARAALDEHRAILKALQARDAEAAEAAMRRHISHARRNLAWIDGAAAPVAMPSGD